MRIALQESAQTGHGVKRAAPRSFELPSGQAARIGGFCAWYVLPLFASLLAGTGSLLAQSALPFSGAMPGRFWLCHSKQPSSTEAVTFEQRACFYGSNLLSPWGAVHGAFTSGVGQWENIPRIKAEDFGDYAHRFGVFYVRRTARDASELIAGYLNHENPLPHSSGETGTGRRIRTALLSVLVVSDENGTRPSLVPIAGSLGPAFAGAAFYRYHSGLEYVFRGASVGYSCYFVKAVLREFQPEMSLLAGRVLRKKTD